jgi:hypothetical protein
MLMIATEELSLRLHERESTHIAKVRQMHQPKEIGRCSWFDLQRHHSQRGSLRPRASVFSPWKRTMTGWCRPDLRWKATTLGEQGETALGVTYLTLPPTSARTLALMWRCRSVICSFTLSSRVKALAGSTSRNRKLHTSQQEREKSGKYRRVYVGNHPIELRLGVIAP